MFCFIQNLKRYVKLVLNYIYSHIKTLIKKNLNLISQDNKKDYSITIMFNQKITFDAVIKPSVLPDPNYFTNN